VEIVDLSNSWVMPGIMGAYTHVTLIEESFNGDSVYLVEGTGLRALRGLHTAQILLNAGITTVRDVGNDANFAAVDLRKAKLRPRRSRLSFAAPSASKRAVPRRTTSVCTAAMGSC
jgi:imidazolonepropionase-like amidohydrolase